MSPCIWIVIPAYNRKDITRACLQSIAEQSYRNFRIIVTDDGSTDGTAGMIKEHFPQVTLLCGDGNLFWTKSTNLGVKEALKKAADSDFILTLNNDLIVRNDYLQQMVDLASERPNSIIGSISLDYDDQNTVLDGGVRIHWLTAKFERLQAGNDYDALIKAGNTLREVDALPGRGTLIPVKIFKEIGLYNEDLLPHYAADYEFSIRAKKSGYDLVMNYQAVVMSRVGETGYNNAINTLRWRDYFKSFGSIRSANNLHYRWNFSRLCRPGIQGISFYLWDTVRVVLGTLRNQLFPRPKRFVQKARQ